MTTSLRRTLPLLLAVPTLALAACGGSSDSSQITDLVKQIDKDASVVCDHATDKLLTQLGSTDPAKCKETARGYASQDDAKIDGDINVKVDGDTATATFKTTDGKEHSPTFVKQDGDWKIDTAG